MQFSPSLCLTPFALTAFLSCAITATSVLAACLSGMAQTQQPVEHKQINKQLQTSFVRKFCLFCVSEWEKKQKNPEKKKTVPNIGIDP